MKLGLIADVHGGHEELRLAAAALAREGVTEILLAGDAHDQYRFSNEVVDVIHEYGMRYILGNHEGVLLSRAGERAARAPHVRRRHLDFVRGAPWRLRTTIGGCTLTMVHANPWAPDDAYLFPPDRRFDRLGELDTDVLVLGHTHIPMAFRRGRTLVVNPGSLTFSRAAGTVGAVNYAVLDTAAGQAQQICLPLAELAARAGMPR